MEVSFLAKWPESFYMDGPEEKVAFLYGVTATPTNRELVVGTKEAPPFAMKAKDGKRTAALSGETALVTGARGVMSIPKAKMGKMTEEGSWTLDSYSFDDIVVSTPAPDVPANSMNWSVSPSRPESNWSS